MGCSYVLAETIPAQQQGSAETTLLEKSLRKKQRRITIPAQSLSV